MEKDNYDYKLPIQKKSKVYSAKKRRRTWDVKRAHAYYDAFIKLVSNLPEYEDMTKFLMEEATTYLAPIVLLRESMDSNKSRIKKRGNDSLLLIPTVSACTSKIYTELIIHSIRTLVDRMGVLLVFCFDFNPKDGFGSIEKKSGFIHYAEMHQDEDQFFKDSVCEYNDWIHKICRIDNNLKHNGASKYGIRFPETTDATTGISVVQLPEVFTCDVVGTNRIGRNIEKPDTIETENLVRYVERCYCFANKVLQYTSLHNKGNNRFQFKIKQ